MAVTERTIPEIGLVTFQKRKGSKSVRIHIQGSKVKVTLPYYVPYSTAEKFLITRKAWVAEHLQVKNILPDKAPIGKKHTLLFQYADIAKPRTRLRDQQLVVTLPTAMPTDSDEAQSAARKVAERALLQETKTDIAARLADVAYEHGFSYKSVHIKKLKSRWGSCDNHQNITLNSYLAQLPWPLIDYVLIHELAHTRHMNHSPSFWAEVEAVLPNYKQLRKQTKQHSPHEITTYP